MKRVSMLVLGAIGIVFIGGTPASAADLGGPTYKPTAPVAVAPMRDWTGFYVGIHGGYAWQDGSLLYDNAQPGAPGPFFNLEFDDGIIGGQVGYRIQSGQFVFGIEGDYTGPGREDDVENDVGGVAPDFVNTEAEYLASIRGKLGYAFENILVFGTVGVGFTKYKLNVSSPNSTENKFFGSLKSEEEGAVYGGGIEIKVTDRVSIGAEYLHYDIGKTINIPDDDIPPFIPDADDGDFLKFDDVDVIRASLNFTFGG